MPQKNEAAPAGIAFESWGRYPKLPAKVKTLHWQGDYPGVMDGVHGGALPVGLGRSACGTPARCCKRRA